MVEMQLSTKPEPFSAQQRFRSGKRGLHFSRKETQVLTKGKKKATTVTCHRSFVLNACAGALLTEVGAALRRGMDGWIDGWMGSCGSAQHMPSVLLGTLHDPTWVHDPRHHSVPGIFSGAEPPALVLIQRPARYVEAASLPFPAAPRPGSQGRAALRCSVGAPLAVSRAAFKQPGTAR